MPPQKNRGLPSCSFSQFDTTACWISGWNHRSFPGPASHAHTHFATNMDTLLDERPTAWDWVEGRNGYHKSTRTDVFATNGRKRP
jgi:hypothetical protein